MASLKDSPIKGKGENQDEQLADAILKKIVEDAWQLNLQFQQEQDTLAFSNELMEKRLIELKKLQKDLIEDNQKQECRSLRAFNKNNVRIAKLKAQSKWSQDHITFRLTSIENTTGQDNRPSSSIVQIQPTQFTKLKDSQYFPSFFSPRLCQNEDAVGQKLEEMKQKLESTHEEIFAAQQKQLEILKMKDELVIKEKKLKDELAVMKRMSKLAESRYQNVERIEFHAAENKKHTKKNVANAKQQLISTQQIEENCLEKKKSIYNELQQQISLEENLLQHTFIKEQEMIAKGDSVNRELEKVLRVETQLKDRENEFYLVGQYLWAIETLQKKVPKFCSGESCEMNQYEQLLVAGKDILDSLNKLEPSTPRERKISSNSRRQHYKTRSSMRQTIFKSFDKSTISSQTEEDLLSPPCLSRKEIIERIEEFFKKNNDLEMIEKEIIKNYQTLTIEKETKETKYKDFTAQRTVLKKQLEILEKQLQEQKDKNSFLFEVEDDQTVRQGDKEVIEELLAQGYSMDSGIMMKNTASNVKLTTVNQIQFRISENSLLEEQVRTMHKFVGSCLMGANDLVSRIMNILEQLRERAGNDKFPVSLDSALEETKKNLLSKMTLPDKINLNLKPLTNYPSTLSQIPNSPKAARCVQISQSSLLSEEEQMKKQTNMTSKGQASIEDAFLQQLCKEFQENVKAQPFFKYCLPEESVKQHLKKLVSLYKEDPDTAEEQFQELDGLYTSAYIFTQEQFKCLFGGFSSIHSQVLSNIEECQQQIGLLASYQARQKYNMADILMNTNHLTSHEGHNSHGKQPKRFLEEVKAKAILKFQTYFNSTEDDQLQHFGRTDLQNTMKRLQEDYVESEQEKKSKAIMKFISQISEKKNCSKKSNQITHSEIQKMENQNEISKSIDDCEYLDQQRFALKQLVGNQQNDIPGKINMKKQGIIRSTSSCNSQRSKKFYHLLKEYTHLERGEHKHIQEVAEQSNLLFKINQLDSRYTGHEQRQIGYQLEKDKKDKLLFQKKEFRQLDKNYLAKNKVYQIREQMSKQTRQQLKRLDFDNNFIRNSEQQQSSKLSSSPLLSSYSRNSSISQSGMSLSKRTNDKQAEGNSLRMKILTSRTEARRINAKLERENGRIESRETNERYTKKEDNDFTMNSFGSTQSRFFTQNQSRDYVISTNLQKSDSVYENSPLLSRI